MNLNGRLVSPAMLPASSNSLLCLYSKHLCSRERMHGFDYCQQHILEDR